jgi:hypothetical protein
VSCDPSEKRRLYAVKKQLGHNAEAIPVAQPIHSLRAANMRQRLMILSRHWDRRKVNGMTQVTAPHLVDDGAVKRCSACTAIFDSKSIADLRKSFAEHVRLTHHTKSGEDVK